MNEEEKGSAYCGSLSGSLFRSRTSPFLISVMPSFVPLLSKSWSCASLALGLDQVEQQSERMQVTELTEEEMLNELQVQTPLVHEYIECLFETLALWFCLLRCCSSGRGRCRRWRRRADQSDREVTCRKMRLM